MEGLVFVLVVEVIVATYDLVPIWNIFDAI
jgi:hypothetical protein